MLGPVLTGWSASCRRGRPPRRKEGPGEALAVSFRAWPPRADRGLPSWTCFVSALSSGGIATEALPATLTLSSRPF